MQSCTSTGTRYTLSLKLVKEWSIWLRIWVEYLFLLVKSLCLLVNFSKNSLLLCPSCCVNLEGEETWHLLLLLSLSPVSKISDLLNLGPPYLLTDKAQWLGQKLNSSLPTGSLWFITFHCSEEVSQAGAMSQSHQSVCWLGCFQYIAFSHCSTVSSFTSWGFSLHLSFLEKFLSLSSSCRIARVVFYSWKSYLPLGGWGGGFGSAAPLHSE